MQPMHSVSQQTKVTLVFQAKSSGVQCGANLEQATWLLLLGVLCRKDGYVVAVVRATSDEAAFSRLRAGYDSGAPDLLEAFDTLAKKHLRVYTGQQQPTHAVCIPPASSTGLKGLVFLLNLSMGRIAGFLDRQIGRRLAASTSHSRIRCTHIRFWRALLQSIVSVLI